jgi:hypothetical protein
MENGSAKGKGIPSEGGARQAKTAHAKEAQEANGGACDSKVRPKKKIEFVGGKKIEGQMAPPSGTYAGCLF